jgi:hypothetical protein
MTMFACSGYKTNSGVPFLLLMAIQFIRVYLPWNFMNKILLCDFFAS